MMTLRDEIRTKLSGWAKRADSGSRQAAIWLNCVECMGGDMGAARSCEARECFLWPSGLAARAIRNAQKTHGDASCDQNPACSGDNPTAGRGIGPRSQCGR